MAQLNISSNQTVVIHQRNIPRILPPIEYHNGNVRKNAQRLNIEMDLRVDKLAKERKKQKKYRTPNKLLKMREAKVQTHRAMRYSSLPMGLWDERKRDSSSLSFGNTSLNNDEEQMLSMSYPSRLTNLRKSLELRLISHASPPLKANLRHRITNRSDTGSIPSVDVTACSSDALTMIASRDSLPRASLPRASLPRASLEALSIRRRQASELEAAKKKVPSARYKKRRVRMGPKFKRVARFLGILFALWKVHVAKVKSFLDTNVDLMEYNEPVDLMFDVTVFKADKQGSVSQETKRILMKRPENRTEAEVKHVQVALRNYPAIAEYPLQMTKAMAQRSWLERFDQKRIIIQQSHPAMCYYIILSGSVIVSRMDSEYSVSRTVCFLNRGESFGELGLISNAPRQATVISKEPVELLVFSDEDYVDIFMGGGLKGVSDPFLSNLWCFENWPTEIIANNPRDAFLSYFKRNTVLVPNSSNSEWIYIVKSGSCTVLKKLHEVPPTRVKHEHQVPISHADDQQRRMDRVEAKMHAKQTIRGKLYRRKKLEELKLGIETTPLDGAPGLLDYVGALSAFTMMKKPDTSDDDDENDVTRAADDSQHTGDSVEKQSHDHVVNDASLVEIKENTEEKTLWRKNLSSKGPFLSKTPFDDITTIEEEPSLENSSAEPVLITAKPTDSTESIVADDSDNTAISPDDTNTTQVPTLQKRILDSNKTKQEALTILQQKPTAFKQERKTIMDEINKPNRGRGGSSYVALEDKEPMFVRVQTLTKGEVFGMADLIHQDQPAMSLVSNGAECMLIKKKLYTEHASQTLLNKVRYETSPYPSQYEMQASLQEYVNWVNQKEQTMKQTLLQNIRSKVNVDDARSTVTRRDNQTSCLYTVKMAGPLHG